MNTKADISLEIASALATQCDEIDTNNMTATWPTRAPTQGDPMQPIFHLLALGLTLGIIGSRWACQALRWVQRESLVLVVLPNGNTTNAKPHHEGVRIVVEYRLKTAF